MSTLNTMLKIFSVGMKINREMRISRNETRTLRREQRAEENHSKRHGRTYEGESKVVSINSTENGDI